MNTQSVRLMEHGSMDEIISESSQHCYESIRDQMPVFYKFIYNIMNIADSLSKGFSKFKALGMRSKHNCKI